MKTSEIFQVILMGTGALALSACTGGFNTGSTAQEASIGTSSAQSQVKVGMKIYDSKTAVVYDDSDPNSSLVLKAGQQYNIVLTPSQGVSGMTFSLTLNKTSAIGVAPQVIPLLLGNNAVSVPSQGDYSVTLSAAAPAMQPVSKSYTAEVTCAVPTMSQASIDGSKITVSAGASANNVFNLSATAAISGANGLAPYTCAWDGTGTKIVDTGFGSCDQAGVNFYNNYVAARTVNLLVKDSCNTVVQVSKLVSFPYSVPAMGAQNVFIYGQVSAAAGSAKGDIRVDGTTYLATNYAPNNLIVQPAFDLTGGTFSINAAQNYGMPSSKAFGTDVSISGITGTADFTTGINNLSVTGATIKSISYTTDQSGDMLGISQYVGSSCKLTNQGIKVVQTSGAPCTASASPSKQTTVEVYGSYACTNVNNSTGSVSITGSFDGLSTMYDSCSGGGGGGGGLTPIAF